jgi:hypothetical protein
MQPSHPKRSTSLSRVIQIVWIALALMAVSPGAWALGDALNGQKLYPTCVGCHNIATGQQKIGNAWGTKANQGVPAAITTGINNNPGDMGKYAPGQRLALSATDLADIAAYVNAVKWDNCLATPGTTGITGSTGAACNTSLTGVTTLVVAPPAACAATALSWTVGANTCNATAGLTPSGTTAVVQDTAAPTTGAASYSCTNGAWSAPASTSCVTPPADCAATALSWAVGGNTCNATAALTVSGATAVLQDTTAPSTGAASYSCTNGQWSAPTSTTCVVPPADCAATALNWTVGAYTCNATTALTTSGATTVLQDTTAPTTGAATYSCSNGSWSAPSSTTCATATVAPPASCPAGALSWTVGGNTCNAAAALTTSGSTAILQDTAAPTTGAASYSCSNGVWSAPSATTCVTPPADCLATALSWIAGGNTCNATAALTTSGATAVLQDTTAPTTGSASYSCSNGAWSAPASATCVIPAPTSCPATALSWTVGTSTCNATAALTTSGSTAILQDTSAPTTGAASYSCSNGAWSAPSSTTCATAVTPQASCPAGDISWTTGANICNAAVALTVSGLSQALTDSTAPTTGTAAVSCSNGTWSAPSATVCSVAATGPRAISPANGDLLWRKSLGSSRGACIDCHGDPKPDVVNNLLKINNAMGTAADQGVPSAIRRGIQTSSQMAEFAAVSDADLADLAAYVNAIKYGKPLTDSAGVVPEKPYVLVQNGAIVTPPIYMPPIVFGSSSSVRVVMALQAPSNAALHVERLAMDKGMFTINRVPVASIDQAAIAAADPANTKADGTATANTKADLQAAGTVNNSQACPPGAFDLQPGQACGIEVVFAVSNPGVVNANLEIYTDPAGAQKPETIAMVSTVTAEAKGGQGAGGCTMSSTPEAFDPMLLLLSFLSLVVLAVRRNKKPEA